MHLNCVDVDLVVPRLYVYCINHNPIVANSQLTTTLRSIFSKSQIYIMPQKNFSSHDGIKFLEDNINKKDKSLLVDIRKLYYALMCISGLFEYLNFSDGISVYPGSLLVNYVPGLNTTLINRQTSEALELISSNHIGGGDKTIGKHGASLFSVLDQCVTASGRKLLRTSILGPPCDLETIQSRQLAVQELRDDDSLLFGIQTVLRKCPYHLEKTLAWGIRLEKKMDSIYVSEQTVSHCVYMLEALEILPELKSAIHGKSTIFCEMSTHLNSTAFEVLLEALKEAIQPEIRFNLKGQFEFVLVYGGFLGIFNY